MIKLRRQGLMQDLPLLDTGGQSFRFAQWHAIAEQLQRIDMGIGGVIEMPEPVTNPESKDRYLIRNLMEEAITSSQLEGAVTTRPIAKDMIRSGRAPRDNSEQMILNNYRTMQRIVNKKDRSLTPDLVFDIHRLITENTLDDPSASGRPRRRDERIRVEDMYGTVFHNPPHADELPRRLEAMCDFANAKTPERFIHPVLRAIILHFWLAYDHPFVDGNGRVARALFYWSMLRNGYWLCEFISISQIIRKAPAKYYRAFLHTETDENDLTYFILHQLDVMHKAMDELHTYITRESQRSRALRLRLQGLDLLNHRQCALMDHALNHSEADYTIQSHQSSHGVVNQTARKDLLDLADRGLLTVRKVGRIYRFRPVPDLAERLTKLD
ncbi:MAG: Fic family protein [Phycisphaerae bacterium]